MKNKKSKLVYISSLTTLSPFSSLTIFINYCGQVFSMDTTNAL